MTPDQREGILADEFLRPNPPGLRPFSVALLRIARRLGLSIALPKHERQSLSPGDLELEQTALCFLFDETNDLRPLIDCPAMTLASFTPTLKAYEWRISPMLLIAVEKEMERTLTAIGAGAYHVQAKPGAKDDPQPPGKS